MKFTLSYCYEIHVYLVKNILLKMVSDKTTRYQITLSYSYILCVLIMFKYVSIATLQSNLNMYT